jgi:hypothetical protein
MEFTRSRGETIEFDPFDQRSIDAAKAIAPGEGIGPAAGCELLKRIADGSVARLNQLPVEYQRLGRVMGLPD